MLQILLVADMLQRNRGIKRETEAGATRKARSSSESRALCRVGRQKAKIVSGRASIQHALVLLLLVSVGWH